MPDAKDRRTEMTWIALIWVCFLARGFFYVGIIPLWEGYDEWAHFAYAQHVLAHGNLPLGATTRVSREIEASFELLPLPWAMDNVSGTKVTHDMYWQLPQEEQAEHSRKLRTIPPEWGREFAQQNILLYEAQQPPLYYWLLAGPLFLTRNLPIPERVYLLRYLSLLTASVVIPIGYFVARRALGCRGLAIGVIAVVALMPGFILELSRVANDSLATALYSALLWLALKVMDEPGRTGWALAYAVTLALGLLTKAYFLTAVPATALLFVALPEGEGRAPPHSPECLHDRGYRDTRGRLVVCALPAADRVLVGAAAGCQSAKGAMAGLPAKGRRHRLADCIRRVFRVPHLFR